MSKRNIGLLMILFMFILPFGSMGLSYNTSNNMLNNKSTIASVKQVTREAEFHITKNFNFKNIINPENASKRNVDALLSGISSFSPSLNYVSDLDVYESSITIKITKIKVIEDRDFGPGEIYLKVKLNNYYEYTLNNNGQNYVANDGDIVYTNIKITKSIYSITKYIIRIDGYESDADFDDYMGGLQLSYDADNTYDTSSRWFSLNTFSPDGGNHDVQLEVYMSISFDTHHYSYPNDFYQPYGDGSYLISLIYSPILYYDTFDRGDIPGIRCIYQKVYHGYDPQINSYSYVIFYLFYYDYETDNFGINFGHYYDFEPLLLFVKNIGDEPYRIVFNGVGPNTLPSKLIIQDKYASHESSHITANVSKVLMPILGSSAEISYEVRNDYWDNSAYHSIKTSIAPDLEVPIFTITNTYHQMELGKVLNNRLVSIDHTYFKPLTDEVINWSYSLLREAFTSHLNKYEGVELWNGGNYMVPENMSLTIDMLHNPFEFPYVIDCWEDIVHQVQSVQHYMANGIYYNMTFNIEFILPAKVTFTIPETVTKGHSYDIGIDFKLLSDDIVVKFSYDIYYQFIFAWWFINSNSTSHYVGNFEFEISLSEISAYLNNVVLDNNLIKNKHIREFLTINKFKTSPNLLGTLLDSRIDIHLFSILKKIFDKGSSYIIMKVLSVFIDEIDLVVEPTISGKATALITSNSKEVSFDTSKITFTESSTHKDIKMNVNSPDSDNIAIALSNIQYHLQFYVNWGIELNFSNILNHFVDDQFFYLGTFPNITWSSPESNLTASSSSRYDEPVTMSVSQSTSSSSTTTSDSNTQTSTHNENTNSDTNTNTNSNLSNNGGLGTESIIGFAILGAICLIAFLGLIFREG